MKSFKLAHQTRFFFSVAQKKCLYKTLNISTSASPEEIRKAYLEQAKKYHPDANPNVAQAEDLFKEIHEAYKTLTDEGRRRQYDEENGIRNVYAWQKMKMGFGNAQSLYEKFGKVDSEDIKKKINLDKEFYSYFEANYFKNTDFIYNPDKINDEYDVTPLLLRRKEELKQRKRTHKIYSPFSNNAYYDSTPAQEKQYIRPSENKDDKKIIDEKTQKIMAAEQENKKYIEYDEETKTNEQIEKENFAKFHNNRPEYSETQLLELKNKEKIFICFGFMTVLTLIGVIQGIIESNKNKQEIQRARVNNYGSGITAKSTPLSLF